MAPWHCYILFICLLSPLKAEWKEEIEKQMKKVLSIVEAQAEEIMALKKRVNVLETMNRMSEETEMRLASAIRETETNISHIAKTLDEQSLTQEGKSSDIN